MPRPVRKDDQDSLGLLPTSNHTPEPTHRILGLRASLRSLLRPWMTTGWAFRLISSACACQCKQSRPVKIPVQPPGVRPDCAAACGAGEAARSARPRRTARKTLPSRADLGAAIMSMGADPGPGASCRQALNGLRGASIAAAPGFPVPRPSITPFASWPCCARLRPSAATPWRAGFSALSGIS